MLAMIPASAKYTSLNLAAAVQIMCYELRMAVLENSDNPLQLAPEKAIELATIDNLEGFYAHLEQTLLHIGYLNPVAPKKLMQRLRKIYARVRLEKEEVNLLRGILTLTQVPKNHDKY